MRCLNSDDAVCRPNIFIRVTGLQAFMTKLSFMAIFKLRSMFCGQMCVKIIDNTQVTIQPFVCFNLTVYRPSFQKNKFYQQNIHVNWWKLPKNVKKCFLGNKFLVIPIRNSKYMPCLPNTTLSNDGNIPGITLWVRKMPDCMISTKS